MAKKIFKTDKLDQVKERTTNMFQQCGGSGTVSPPQQYEASFNPPGRETELKICTLESTYRTPYFTNVPRHCVSDSNIFIHRDMDWYREPRPLCYEADIQPLPSAPNAERVETFTTRVQTPGNVLVRFRTFLGMEGSTVEVVTNNSDCVPKRNESALVKMRTLLGSKGRQRNIEDRPYVESPHSEVSKIDKMKSLFKGKTTGTSQQSEQITETVLAPGERIVRMKTFFANRTPANNTVVIESKTSCDTKYSFGRIKTLFKADAGSQTDDIPSPTPVSEENQRGKRWKLRNALGIANSRTSDTSKVENVKNIDERQVFSRQSTLPTQPTEQQNTLLRVPIWMDNFTKRIRASCSGARVNDIEIPNAVVIAPGVISSNEGKKRKLGSLTGWRWRHGDAVNEAGRKSNNKSCCKWKYCAFPACPFPKLTLTPSATEQVVTEATVPFTQVIALICGILVVVLMALGLSSADWLMAAGWRQGLFTHCVEEGAPTPLPFNLVEQPGCYASRDVGYIRAAAALCIVTLCADLLGSLLTGLGLRSTDHRTKYKYYRLAVLAMSLALISILIALVIYPVCFAAELNLGNRTVWEFGWAYGVGWGAAIFLFGAVILLLCDKESEEIYYKERKVERAQPPGGA